jgi:hypothetical protein
MIVMIEVEMKLHIGTRSWEIWNRFGSGDCGWICWCNLRVTRWDWEWNCLGLFWLTWNEKIDENVKLLKMCELRREIKKSRTRDRAREDRRRRQRRNCGARWPSLSWVWWASSISVRVCVCVWKESNEWKHEFEN